uniref:Uncharacterized protein n=1 Tax=Rhizophora mucronata TaxID=61149 RepID=A0A2P2PBK0_RHIMU
MKCLGSSNLNKGDFLKKWYFQTKYTPPCEHKISLAREYHNSQ